MSDELVVVNRILQRHGLPLGAAGVDQVVRQLGRVSAIADSFDAWDLKRLRAMERDLGRLMRETGPQQPSRPLTDPVAVQVAERLRKAEEDAFLGLSAAEGLRAELERREREAGRMPDCPCGYASPLYNVFGHDTLGHKMSNILMRAGYVDPDLIASARDEDLLVLRHIGSTSMDRLHERMEHCTEWVMGA